ncbi:hypothetical protein ACLBT0_19045, partial [Pseudomonas aeruginosa]
TAGTWRTLCEDGYSHEALQVNQSTGGLVLHPGMRPPPR